MRIGSALQEQNRAAVLLLDGARVALIERVRAGGIYYLFPGGSVEANETPAAAAGREAEEELGLHVRVGRLIATVQFRGGTQFYFLATSLGGTFGTGLGAELLSTAGSAAGTYRPIWLPCANLLKRDVRPRAVAALLHAATARGSWPAASLCIVEES